VDYSLDSFHDFENLSTLVLIGGGGWGDEHLISGYNPGSYNRDVSQKINDFVTQCLSHNKIVAAICDHTGNTAEYLKEKAPAYTGAKLFQEQQAVTGGNIITANGTAVLEFTREILIKLDMLGGKDKAVEWYQFFKNGYYPAPAPEPGK
jgi:putative intracellular protease/amidase